uniref:HD domain-containing protein n=1 Tax=Candidatus Kentrum sp. DK TaxID=2126562 RepID=A0A450SXN8_9GAMM|nr:MAG: HD domain-containing protein [Candidatus Kentron sp. DK]
MHTGDMPPWLQRLIEPRQDTSNRLEIEVKFLLRRVWIGDFVGLPDTRIQAIEQRYLPFDLVHAQLPPDRMPEDADRFEEWRIRKLDEQYFLTAKRPAGQDAAQRVEYEIGIVAPLYGQLLAAADAAEEFFRVAKTRYSRVVEFARQSVLVQIDDYRAVGRQQCLDMDFVTCEVEVPDPRLARILRSGRFFVPELGFLNQGIDLTGIKDFSNRRLAEHGFLAEDFDGLLDRLRAGQLERLHRIVEAGRQRTDAFDTRKASELITEIGRLTETGTATTEATSDKEIAKVQDVLRDLAFGTPESLGRPRDPGDRVRQLDAMGKGWLHDYHVIISADAYLRLHSKPQVFRPGVGHTNTTTRGAHTQDVTAASMQLARQLGLNAELCAAIAALHDIGHPAGGHIGEEILFEHSGKRFKHHVFSLSLADLFGFNLLREVQVGAFYHKSGGKKLAAPPDRPQEYGVVRIADKICYTPWDLFDSMTNGYLDREDVPEHLFEIMGNTPLEWIQTMVDAVVYESARAHAVQFSPLSGEIFEAFQAARALVFQRVHSRIRWELLAADMGLCYHVIRESFPDLDPVPIVAYMTDAEVARVARLAERLPKGGTLKRDRLREEGLGFVDIIDILRKKNPGPDILYYVSAKGAVG